MPHDNQLTDASSAPGHSVMSQGTLLPSRELSFTIGSRKRELWLSHLFARWDSLADKSFYSDLDNLIILRMRSPCGVRKKSYSFIPRPTIFVEVTCSKWLFILRKRKKSTAYNMKGINPSLRFGTRWCNLVQVSKHPKWSQRCE